ncbi:MAG: DMT family transporter [Burkholderiales bacterium]
MTAALARFRALSPRVRAISYMMVMVFCFSILETIAKYLSRSYPVPMIVWSRYAVHATFMLLLLARMGPRLMRTGMPTGQVFRASLLVGSTSCYFMALSYLPMADTKAISFVAPLLVTAFAVWILHEHVGWSRWAAVIAGFLGVLFIIRPGGGMLQWPALLPLLAAVFYSLYQIMTRKISDTESPLTTLFYTGIVGCAWMSIAVPFFWKTPQLHHVPLFLVLGMAAGFGHFMLIKALELENASVLSPLGYVQMVWVILFGFLVFGELPGLTSLIGMAIIVGSGLYVAIGHHFGPREEPDTAIE